MVDELKDIPIMPWCRQKLVTGVPPRRRAVGLGHLRGGGGVVVVGVVVVGVVVVVRVVVVVGVVVVEVVVVTTGGAAPMRHADPP